MAQTQFRCPSCTQQLTADADALRRRFQCARCGTEFRPLDVLPVDTPLPAIALDEAEIPLGPRTPALPAALPLPKGPPLPKSPAQPESPAQPKSPVQPKSPAQAKSPAPRTATARLAVLRVQALLSRLRSVAEALFARLTARLGRERALAVLGLGAVAALGLVLLLTFTLTRGPSSNNVAKPTASMAPVTQAPVSALGEAALAPPKAEDARADEAADRDLVRTGSDNVGEGVLYVPDTFHSADGSFDLLLHFNGQPAVVVQSAARAGLNALVHVTNVERGTKYHKYLRDPVQFATLLEQIRAQAEKRGLRGGHLRRLALGSFGSGSGTLAGILGIERNVERIDAIYVLEGLQARWLNKQRERVDPNDIAPFLVFARLASQGQKLFVITHSHGGGDDKHAGAARAADAILEAVGATRVPDTTSPPPAELEGAAKLFADGKVPQLEAESTAQAQGLHVLGYANTAPGHQLAHMVEMSVTVLPLLVDRWSAAGR